MIASVQSFLPDYFTHSEEIRARMLWVCILLYECVIKQCFQ